MPAAMQANGLAPDEPASRTVEVEAFCSWSACRMKIRSMARDEHRIDLVLLARHREAHAQEVRRVVERVQRINERLADVVLVGHRRDRRHLGDHAERSDHALVRIGDVGRVVIEGRQRADHAAHDRHRMRVAAEAGEEAAHLLVDHRVVGDAVVEVGLLRRRRQFAVEQQVAGLEEVAVLGQLLDRIAAIEQDALVAVDEGDLRIRRRRSR